MHPRRLLPHVRNPATSALNAKFSLPYAVSRGLVNGAVLLDPDGNKLEIVAGTMH